jgi:membrane-associated phospholipid phosphatase
MADDDRRLALRLGVAGVLVPALLMPFMLLAGFVMGDWSPLRALDGRISIAMHDWALRNPFWSDAMIVWSWIFSPTGLRLAALVLVIWLIRARHAHRLAVWVAVTTAAGGIVAALLKLVVERDRPEFLDPVARATGYAFPSGHAANAALVATVFLLVLLPFTRGRPRRRAALWTAAIVVTLVTGLARIVIGVHWTSDVLAGWLFGVAVVAATTIAFRGVRRRRPAGEPAAVEGLDPAVADRI